MESTKEILKQLTILYAEDDDFLREHTTKTLQLICGCVLVAKDGAEALELYQKNRVHIVMLDYVMPCIDGYHVAKEIRESDRDIPIFIASAYTEKEKLMNFIGLDIVRYIEKPLNYSLLIEALGECVKRVLEKGMFLSEINKDTRYDYLKKSMVVDENIIPLTKKEIDLIELLLKNRSKLVSNELIEEVVFQKDIEPNALRNLVYRLRKKIGKDVLVNIKDVGYMIV